MKFISSSYNKETGEATVVMQHLGVKFTGTAIAHPDELDVASEYTGCWYAETRATIKALKYERQLAKNKADMALDFIKSCECYAKFNKNDETAKGMYKQLNVRIQKVNDLTDKINDLLWQLKSTMEKNSIVYNKLKRDKLG